MPKLRFALDSCMVIKHLNHELDLDNFFNALDEYEKCVSVITFIETLAASDMTIEEETVARDFLSGCAIIDITPEIREKAIRIRRFRKNLKLPDALIAATAIELKSILLSTDIHFRGFSWPGFSLQIFM
jgi:predicted nucleic acid-binding protein